MEEKQKKKHVGEVKPPKRINLALSCDKYVNSEDRIAGYVVVETGGCVGSLGVEDINRFLKAGELKAVEG